MKAVAYKTKTTSTPIKVVCDETKELEFSILLNRSYYVQIDINIDEVEEGRHEFVIYNEDGKIMNSITKKITKAV
jgi:hypothetical protein